MSKKIDVNPDHYKTRGREPQGQDVIHDLQRQKLTRERAARDTKSETPPQIPGTIGKKTAAKKTKSQK